MILFIYLSVTYFLPRVRMTKRIVSATSYSELEEEDIKDIIQKYIHILLCTRSSLPSGLRSIFLAKTT